MQTRIQELRGPAVAGGLAVLGGVAVWQLGIEFERAWMRSYDGPLLGEAPVGDHAGAQAGAQLEDAIPVPGERRRWVSGHHPRIALRPTHVAWRGRG